MGWKEDYTKKSVTAEEAVSHIKSAIIFFRCTRRESLNTLSISCLSGLI